jgi:hypothetical protein
MSEDINQRRRHFLGAAATAIAAAKLGIIGSAYPQPIKADPVDVKRVVPETNSSFDPIAQGVKR